MRKFRLVWFRARHAFMAGFCDERSKDGSYSDERRRLYAARSRAHRQLSEEARELLIMILMQEVSK